MQAQARPLRRRARVRRTPKLQCLFKQIKRSADPDAHATAKPAVCSLSFSTLRVVLSCSRLRLVLPSLSSVTPCLSLDCEFVGVGVEGKDDALARVSIVNFHEVVLYDRFVRPSEPVTDYRTAVSGIKPGAVHGKSAITFAQAQREVAAMIEGRILVGHALHNDLTVLRLSHPKHLLRDTSRSRLLCPEGRPRSLKNLARDVLGLEIQTAAHDSVQDARVTLQLYKKHRTQWEKEIWEKQKKAVSAGRHAHAAPAAAAAAAGSSSSAAAPAAASAASSSSAASASRPSSHSSGGSYSAKRANAQAESDAAKLEARRAAKVERNQRRKKMRTEQKAEKQFG